MKTSRNNQLSILLFLILMLLSTREFYGQTVWLKKATQQKWAGGICCIHGINYEFGFQIIRGNKNFSLDTIWTEGYCHPVERINQNMKFGKDTTLQLSYGIRMDDYYTNKNDSNRLRPCYDATRKGIILVYRINKIRFEMDFTIYVKELEFIGYP